MISRVALISLHASPLQMAGQHNAGGLNVYVRALTEALALRGLDVDIYTRRTDNTLPDVVELVPGARVIHVDAGPLEPLPPDELLPFVPLFTAGVIGFAGLHEKAYDLVHSHYWLSGLVALRLKRRWRVPSVHMFHTLARVKRRVAGVWSPADERRAVLEQEVIDSADVVVTANALEGAELRHLYGASLARTQAIPCGVDLALFAPGDRAAARRQLDLPAAAPIIFTAARIEPLKDIGTAVDAVGRLEALGVTGAHLVVAGGPVTGPAGAAELRRLHERADAIGMAGRLRLVGAVPQRALPLYSAAADAVIVPSLYESFGMVALEALACGRPVVASNAGGLQLTIHSGQNGYLVTPGDAPAFAARLESILRNPVLAQRMGLAARRSAEPYGWAMIADRTLCLYESLVSCHRGAVVGR